MIGQIIFRVLVLVTLLMSVNAGWGLCKLANAEHDKAKQGTLAWGMFICFLLAGILAYKIITL